MEVEAEEKRDVIFIGFRRLSVVVVVGVVFLRESAITREYAITYVVYIVYLEHAKECATPVFFLFQLEV